MHLEFSNVNIHPNYFLSDQKIYILGGYYMTFRQVKKALEKNGWTLVRSCGSHFQFTHKETGKMVTLPYHSGKDISIGTLKSIQKSTGLSLR